ncbi:hypothetical protein J113_22895 [Mycobacterium tuberculosis CAS/NITR204]|uniref:Uncharacterized protein n=1 Tax=Mycobacterium tuberculosis CAS/NITR204 TaxID=1310114 RepID=R4MMK5_MYCTX|nr:hypothetical protein J113_22895 [Mycobacterium tuberculosis CAS/NITR204]
MTASPTLHRDVDHTHTDRQDDLRSGSGRPAAGVSPPPSGLMLGDRTTPSIVAPDAARASKSALVDPGLGHDVKLAPPGSSTDQLVAQ